MLFSERTCAPDTGHELKPPSSPPVSRQTNTVRRKRTTRTERTDSRERKKEKWRKERKKRTLAGEGGVVCEDDHHSGTKGVLDDGQPLDPAQPHGNVLWLDVEAGDEHQEQDGDGGQHHGLLKVVHKRAARKKKKKGLSLSDNSRVKKQHRK